MPRMVSPTARQLAPAHLEWTNHAEWERLRREGIGGSDIPVVMGAEAFGRTRWQLWLDKTGALPAEETTERAAESMRFGHRMEAVAAAEWADRFPGTRFRRVGMLARADAPWMRVNVDRIMYGCPYGSPCSWECKNRNAFSSADWDRTGDADNIPDAPVLQVQWANLILGYGHGHIAAVIGGNELRPYLVESDPVLHKLMEQEAGWFWHDCVQAGQPPPVDAAERTGKILARLWDADPDKILTASPDIAALHAALHDAADAARTRAEDADRIKHEIQAWMGDAEILLDPETGRPLATWKQNGTFREGDFRAAEPDLWAKYSRQVTVTDTARLAEAEPATWRQWRSRSFLLKKRPVREGR
jgi:putative phage-type endonuclease